MSTRRSTLFISNIPWSFVWQRHQTLASLFATDGRVIFCEMPGVRRVGPKDLPRIWRRFLVLRRGEVPADPIPANVTVLRPFVLPATNQAFHALNRRFLDGFLPKVPELRTGVRLIMNYSAARSALDLIERVPHEALVYDCTDDWLAVPGAPACLADDERMLLAEADLTLVPSRRLEELKRPFARSLVRLPHGAFIDRFRVPRRTPSADGACSLLYYGHLHAQHLDLEALQELARNEPHWRITLVGPIKTRCEFPPNVVLAGQQPHGALSRFVEEADVLLLPYRSNDYTASVLPAKTFECLATGRPIVATPLPELVARFGHCMTFASGAREIASAVRGALVTDSPEMHTRRVALAEENTWQARYQELRELLARLPAQ